MRPRPDPRRRLGRLLGLIFFLSGLASLVYQVAWQRLLTLHYGVGAVSITLIVSIYMFGLGVGGLVGGVLAERVRRRTLLYAAIEALLAVFGLASLPLLDLLGRHTAGRGLFVSAAGACLFLGVPTLLMGTTLPLLTKIFNSVVRHFLATVSLLYFLNTLGAAVGALVASYVIISWSGLDSAVHMAAATNLLLAVLLWRADALARSGGLVTHGAPPTPRPETRRNLGRLAYVLVAVTGFLAIGYEIVWFRLTGILVKGSPYAFSTALAVYLFGVAIGSYWMRTRLHASSPSDRQDRFFHLQAAIGLYALASVAAYYHLSVRPPFDTLTDLSFQTDLHPLPRLPSGNLPAVLAGLFALIDVAFWPLVFVLVPTALMGASFPLIASLALADPEREGHTVGTVYFFNVAGNVCGGIVTGFVLLPWLGTEVTLLAFGAASGLFALGARAWGRVRLGLPARLAAVAATLALATAASPAAGQLYRAMHRPPGPGYRTYVEEGLDGVVVTYERGERIRNYQNGLGHGFRPGIVYSLQTFEALSYAPGLDDVLIIGYGTGSTTEMVLSAEDARRVTVVELSPTLLANLRKMDLFATMLADPRVRLVIDDGRRFLLHTDATFDAILMDPIRSTTAYSNNLYSREFFTLARERLRPGGVLLLWLDERHVLPRTLAAVFPYVRLYHYFCLASTRPLVNDPARRARLLDRHPAIRRQLENAPVLYRGDRAAILAASDGYPINRDRKPRAEYYLGLRLREWLAAR